MALSSSINKSKPEDKHVNKLWTNFKSHYDYLGNKWPIIFYPDREFDKRGIPTPWQTIAWRRIIRMLGEENFSNLDFTLNFLGNEDVLFEKKFTERFMDNLRPKDLEVTFICGYFWKYNPKRRVKMLNFVAKFLLERGTRVEIWTQDKTLEDDFGKIPASSPKRGNPIIHAVEERIDVHYTFILDRNALDDSLLLLELPHTEAHNLRLETNLTFGELKGLNCEPIEFEKVLRGYTEPTFSRRFFSRFNMALNT